MKKTVYTLLVCTFAFSAIFLMTSGKCDAQILANPGIQWVSMESAQALNKKSPKPIFIDVYTHWCGPCKMLTNGTFKDPAVIEYVNDNFYPVKFDAESPETIDFAGKTYANPGYVKGRSQNQRNSAHELVRYFQVPGYPTMMILDKELNTAGKIVGYKNPQQLLDALKGIPLGS